MDRQVLPFQPNDSTTSGEKENKLRFISLSLYRSLTGIVLIYSVLLPLREQVLESVTQDMLRILSTNVGTISSAVLDDADEQKTLRYPEIEYQTTTRPCLSSFQADQNENSLRCQRTDSQMIIHDEE